ncbi:hypothetical protein ACWC2T_43775 [Streptomyces sp. NPDC001393]
MSLYMLITAALAAFAVLGTITAIACTALRRAEPTAVPDVLRELVPLLGILVRRERP